jgi:lipopolysaccharide export LptBFGC system permease protein LptF
MYGLILQHEQFKQAVMKRTVYLFTVSALAIVLSINVASAQETPPPKAAEEKQKLTEEKLKTLSEQEQKEALQKKKQQEIEIKKRIITEEEMQKKIAEIEAAAAERERHFERIARDYNDQVWSTEEFSRKYPVVVMPDEKMFKYVTPDKSGIYIFGSSGQVGKPGSSWNYSRQVMEATFTNEFTMSAGEETNVNLSVSGDCAEGSMTVAIIMPDGKQLSEVIIDANGSLNWRKSFETDQGNGWKNGKWVFKIKARNATGNLRISMNSD